MTLSHHCTGAWVTRPERPKGAKDEVKPAQRAADQKLGPGGPPKLLVDYNDNYYDNYNDNYNDNHNDDTKGGEEVLVQGQPLKTAQTQEGFGWGHQHIQYLFKYLNI